MLKSVVKHTIEPAIPPNVDTQEQISKLTFTRAGFSTQLPSQRSQPARLRGRSGALADTSFASTASRR